MATIKEVLEDMQHRVSRDDPSDCNLPLAITVTANGKYMIMFSLSSKSKVYNNLDELCDDYENEWL